MYTKTNGIQKFISKGVKKKSGNLNPLGIYEITFYKSPKQDLGNITEINQTQVYYSKNISPLKNIISFFLADLFQMLRRRVDLDLIISKHAFDFVVDLLLVSLCTEDWLAMTSQIYTLYHG